jgi:MoaA/NifB/PqqE/SkfB family radical SAM enzyme
MEFRLLTPVATGSALGDETFSLDAAGRRTLRDFHIRHNRRGAGPAVAALAYLESPEMFGCGGGFHHLHIDAGGEVCPCDLTPLSFGNITDEPLEHIWTRMGRTFDRPRCRCLMADLAGRISPQAALPLAPSASRTLCPPPDRDEPLPQAYRRLGPMHTAPCRMNEMSTNG